MIRRSTTPPGAIANIYRLTQRISRGARYNDGNTALMKIFMICDENIYDL
jgi:hypothetical protein